MHPLLKVLRILIFFVFAWVVIIGGSVGIFMLVRDTLTNQNVVLAAIVTIIFLFAAIALGERFAHMVNCLLARVSNQDPPACSTGKED
jgi:hypothetical protein